MKRFKVTFRNNSTGEVGHLGLVDYTIEDCLFAAMKIADFSDRSVIGITDQTSK